MKTKRHILVVDYDTQICDLLRDYLEQHGLRVSTANNGVQMWQQIKKSTIDLVVLDIMLPGEDGLTLCRKLRENSEVSIIMLSAVNEEADRIVGLEVGADDYLSKPFSPRELLARIKALVRRTTGELGQKRQSSHLNALPAIRFNDWTLDRNRRLLISPESLTVPLSAGEYDLLIAFIEHPKRVLTRDQLLDLTRGKESLPFDRSIDVQVARLRKKIEEDPKNPNVIITVRSGGYQLNADTHNVTES